MLGRCRRRVLVCDLGQPRNRRSRALHGYLTRDGIAPARFDDLGRGELAPYGSAVPRGRRHGGAADGGRLRRDARTMEPVKQARYLLLATGVVDELPAIGGLADCYGRSVFHCPYCDGWEWRDRRLAVLGREASGAGLALSMKTWSTDVVLLHATGSRLSAGHPRPSAAQRRGRSVVSAIARLEHDGRHAPHDCLSRRRAARRATRCSSPPASIRNATSRCDLGCAFNRQGTVRPARSATRTFRGVFVAGDASRDAQFVIVAAAEGVKAALAINQALQTEELRA